MTQTQNIMEAPSSILSPMGRWFSDHRGFAKLLILVVAVTTPLLLAFNWNHKLFFIPLELGTKFLLVYPAIRANCRWFGSPVTRFRTDKKALWLTIDDGPHPEDTPQMLELLKKHNARATFFVIGRRVETHPELAQSILRAGHTLANHSQTHPASFFWMLPERHLTQEIVQCDNTLRKTVGEVPRWFRAPAGMANLFLHFLLGDRGMKLIGWSARGFDGVFHNTKTMANLICKSIRPGTIILLHEGRRDQRGRPINLILAETILSRLTAEGYVFTVPDEKDFL